MRRGECDVYASGGFTSYSVDRLHEQISAGSSGGSTGLRVAEVCNAFSTPISAHTAPQLDVHVCCAAPRVLHLEWFHDHARIDTLIIDGAIPPTDGGLRPDRSRPWIGLALKEPDAADYRVY